MPTPASAAEKALHWLVAATVSALVLSGAVLYAPALSQAAGNRFWVRTVHLVAAAALAAAPALLALARPGEVRSLERALSRWGPADLDWFLRAWRTLVGGRDEPATDGGTGPPPLTARFNAGQKLFAALVAVAIASLFLTGIPMAWWSRFGAALVARARDLHVVASFALVVLLAGHVYLALLSPYGLLQARLARRR